jgi:hypothetical protein
MGTAALSEDVPLKQDVARFYNYCMEPGRVDRGGAPYSVATVEGYLVTISLFIGFLHRFYGIGPQHWSLQLASNQFFITAFIGFKCQTSQVCMCLCVCVGGRMLFGDSGVAFCALCIIPKHHPLSAHHHTHIHTTTTCQPAACLRMHAAFQPLSSTLKTHLTRCLSLRLPARSLLRRASMPAAASRSSWPS